MKPPPPIGRIDLPIIHTGLLTLLGCIVVVPLAIGLVLTPATGGGGSWGIAIAFAAVAILLMIRAVVVTSLRVTITDEGIERRSLGRPTLIRWPEVLIVHSHGALRGRRGVRFRILATDGRLLTFVAGGVDHRRLHPLLYHLCRGALIISEDEPSFRGPKASISDDRRRELVDAGRVAVWYYAIRTTVMVLFLGYAAAFLIVASAATRHGVSHRMLTGVIGLILLAVAAGAVVRLIRGVRQIKRLAAGE